MGLFESPIFRFFVAIVLSIVYKYLRNPNQMFEPRELEGEFVKVADIGDLDLNGVNEIIIRSNSIEITKEDK